jgi:HEPN domain-containing protein
MRLTYSSKMDAHEINKVVDFWIQSSDQDYKTMTDLFATKNFHWSLFMGHLVIEKLLKAHYSKINGKFPPLLHDLRRLAELGGLTLDQEQIINLDTITRFNINARYDNYRQSFFKLCTEEFTKEWITRIDNTRIWIKNLL